MRKIEIAVLVCGVIAVTTSVASAQPNLPTSQCQVALQDLTNQWNALGLPVPMDNIGGIQTKGGTATVGGRSGHQTSLANFQYMTLEIDAAAAACRAGANDAAMEKVALVRERLEPLSR